MELIFHSLINVAKKQRKVNYTSSSIVFVMLVTYVTTRTNKKKHKAFVTHNPSHKRWRRSIKLFTLSVFVCLSVTVLCQACLLHFFLTIPRSLFFPVWRRGTCQSRWRTWGSMPHPSPSAWPPTFTSEGLSSSWWKRHVGSSVFLSLSSSQSHFRLKLVS